MFSDAEIHKWTGRRLYNWLYLKDKIATRCKSSLYFHFRSKYQAEKNHHVLMCYIPIHRVLRKIFKFYSVQMSHSCPKHVCRNHRHNDGYKKYSSTIITCLVIHHNINQHVMDWYNTSACTKHCKEVISIHLKWHMFDAR